MDATAPGPRCGTVIRSRYFDMSQSRFEVVFSLNDRRLLGVHIIGAGATDLSHIGQAVLNLGGTVDYFAALDALNRHAVRPRPAARNWRRDD